MASTSSTLPSPWKEYYSDRAKAPYYVNPLTSMTQWERPIAADDENQSKKRKIEDESAISNESQNIENIKIEYEEKIQLLNKKILNLSARGSVAAGHNAQHGHIAMLSSNEAPLPKTPVIIKAHMKSDEIKWTRKDLMVQPPLVNSLNSFSLLRLILVMCFMCIISAFAFIGK